MGYWSVNAALQDERYYGEKSGMEKGLEIGREEGRLEGVALGEKKLSDLLSKLMAEGRTEDVSRAINELDYREKLYRDLMKTDSGSVDMG